MEMNYFDLSKDHPQIFRPRILIAEDDISIEPIWDYILRKAHPQAKYDWCVSQHEASELLDESIMLNKPYHLIVSDIFLAGPQTGLDLWKRYKDHIEGRVILVSSLDPLKVDHYLGAAKEKPLYLKKPLVPHECIEAVHGILTVAEMGPK